MHIVVIGVGYVGLVTGTCFAEMGNHVVCIDKDEKKLALLNSGHIPIYEPGLEDMVERNVAAGRLHFEADLAKALQNAAVVFIAVGTPQGDDGAADLGYVLAAAAEIGQGMVAPLLVVNKSTVPVGTADKVHEVIAHTLQQRGASIDFEVVSNPEFLKEGSAIKDFMSPDRVIVGANSEAARDVMRELYQIFMRTHDRLMFMGVRDAELTKYAANAMLATKISFINEMAVIAEKVGADIERVRMGIGADNRIGYHFIYPGCGYGGSCFPKDVQALRHIAESHGIEPLMLNAVDERNRKQKTLLFSKLQQHFNGELQGRVIALWGLAFKPDTDDIREATSLVLIRQLLEAGAIIRAHDPVAIEQAKADLHGDHSHDGQLQFFADEYAMLEGADALVLVTEWAQYRQPDFDVIRSSLNTPLIIDGRNQYRPEKLRKMGFVYHGVGR